MLDNKMMDQHNLARVRGDSLERPYYGRGVIKVQEGFSSKSLREARLQALLLMERQLGDFPAHAH